MNLLKPSDVYIRLVCKNLIEKGMCDDPDAFDIGPDRTGFTVAVEMGPKEKALRWFHNHAEGCCRVGDTDRFISFGGCQWEIKEGSVIEVGFAEFFDRWLATEVRAAHSQVWMMAERALGRLETNFSSLS